jgi:hypothetical protein
MTARNISRYERIVLNTIAIAFLGTPHRGSDLANLLSGLLNITFSKRKFVNDLSPASQSIKEINDVFGERTEGFKLVSFWESTPTSPVGVRTRNIFYSDIK